MNAVKKEQNASSSKNPSQSGNITLEKTRNQHGVKNVLSSGELILPNFKLSKCQNRTLCLVLFI